MTEHQHGRDCSHSHAPPGSSEPDADGTRSDATAFHIGFKVAAFVGLILCLALLLPLPGGWEAKKLVVFIGTIIGISIFPLAYFNQKKQ